MGDSLPGTPINRCAKFDAASFIVGGEIRNRKKKHTNSNRYIHTLPISMCGQTNNLYSARINTWITVPYCPRAVQYAHLS